MTATAGIGDTLSHLNIRDKNSQTPRSNELGQTAFLELMITQLENQDPLSPQENGEFIAQLAQFSFGSPGDAYDLIKPAPILG